MYAIVTRRRELHLRFTPDTDSDVLVIAFLLFTFDLADIIVQFQNSLRSKRFCGVREQRITEPIFRADKIPFLGLCSQTPRKRLLRRLVPE